MDQEGESKTLTYKDILVVAPYNGQVFKLSERLRTTPIGTADKFQDQEAPIVIIL
jgi:superfamily I DNA and/or RNA helicase